MHCSMTAYVLAHWVAMVCACFSLVMEMEAKHSVCGLLCLCITPTGVCYVFTAAPYPDSRICKHFITHGCKLGSQCRFLHCTPEELASQMAHEQQKGQGPPPRPNGGPPPHHLESLQQQNHPVMEHMDPPLTAPAPSEQQT